MCFCVSPIIIMSDYRCDKVYRRHTSTVVPHIRILKSMSSLYVTKASPYSPSHQS